MQICCILTTALLLGLAAAPPAAAQPLSTAAPSHPGNQLGYREIYRLDGLDAGLPHQDLAPLRKILKKAQMVGLGETFHTSGGYYAMKHRLFRFLVEEMGFRAFAMETPWIDAQTTGRYVATCQGSVNDAMRGLFPVWASTETGALLTYMCSWNQAHPNDPITFFGFDIQQPNDDGPALIAFLKGRGVADGDSRITGLRRCDGVVAFAYPNQVSDANNQACLSALNAIDALLSQLDPSDAVQRNRAEVEWAKINSIGVRSWQTSEYYYSRNDYARGFTARDRGMATVLPRIRTLLVGSQKTAVWAHNFHIGKGGVGLEELGYVVMGKLLDQEFGQRYAAVALAAAQVTLDWPGLFCGPLPVDPESAEGRLEQLGEPYLLVDLSFHGANPAHPPFLDPEEPILIGSDLYVLRDHYDALVYLETSPAMTPTAWAPCH